ncbi:hypothetical protein Mgra_00008472 [Meloidogyne graminicola]|uniref:Uncharacterized protein n=1 Tax=Meloidogyne graminicola TaxID=189291 RepID=A0A8S9ZFN0_9BILA|nr:hypothetical protein Mgra_00008472 [Meloidogyne graminicola]
MYYWSLFKIKGNIEFANSPLQPLSLINNKLNLKLEAICKVAIERSLARHLFGPTNNDEKMDAIDALNDWQWSSTGNKIKNRENDEKKENEQNSEDKAVKNFTSNTKLEMAAESSFWIDLNSMHKFNVRLLGIDSPKPWRRTFVLSFAVELEGKGISAEVMVNDLSLLSLSEISAHLQLTVLRIDALVNKQINKQTQWWLIGIILGAGILIIGCCWLLLFFWLNICVRKEVPQQLEKGGNQENNIENRQSEEIPILFRKQNVCENDLLMEKTINGKINKKQEQQQQHLEIKGKEEEAKQKISEASLQTALPPPIELEAAIQAINERRNISYQLPTNWLNLKFIEEYKGQQKLHNNNRLRPYWIADKLENIYGIYNKNKENQKSDSKE